VVRADNAGVERNPFVERITSPEGFHGHVGVQWYDKWYENSLALAPGIDLSRQFVCGSLEPLTRTANDRLDKGSHTSVALAILSQSPTFELAERGCTFETRPDPDSFAKRANSTVCSGSAERPSHWQLELEVFYLQES